MRTGRGQRVAAAWAVRGQPCPAVGAELPVRCNLAAAIEALLAELVKRLLELQECGLYPPLLGLLLVLLVVHGVPSVSHCPRADSSLRSRVISYGINRHPDKERVLCPPLCASQPCGSVRKAHGHIASTPFAPLAVFGLGLTPTSPWPPHDGLRVIEDGERRRSGGARLRAPPPALPPGPPALDPRHELLDGIVPLARL